MGTSEHLGLFLDETRDNLHALEVALRDLERAPDDAGALAAVFRVLHSLKGMSAAMGLTAMTDLAHRMEDVLAAVRDEGREVTPAVLTMLAGCGEGLARLADAAAEGREPARVTHRRSDALHATPGGVRVAADHLDALARSAAELGGLVASAQAGDPEALEAMAAAVDALAALVASVRMIPVDDVFLRFPGMVRDLAQALGKLVDLECEGGESHSTGRSPTASPNPCSTRCATRSTTASRIPASGSRRASPRWAWCGCRHAGRARGWWSRCATTGAAWTPRPCGPRRCAPAAWTWRPPWRCPIRTRCGWCSCPGC